jgi:hypothetical protein
MVGLAQDLEAGGHNLRADRDLGTFSISIMFPMEES